MATFSDVKVKKEPGEDDQEVSHGHRFTIQFEYKDKRTYEIDGEEFQTVLDAIKSIDDHPARDWPDENLVIQRKIGGRNFTIATHFPCCLIKEKDEKLIISKRPSIVEEPREHGNVFPEENYSVFYIDTEGANNTRTEKLFFTSQIKHLKPLCVYGEKGITAKDALEQDGRFRPFSSFNLIDCDNENVLKSSAGVDKLHKREFQIELLKENQTNVSKISKSPAASAKKKKSIDTAAESDRCTVGPAASNMAAQSSNTAVASALSKQRGISVKKALKESCGDVDHEEIYKLLRDQFSELKEWMMSRFPADSLQKELRVREENFGKVRQTFTDYYIHAELIKMGKSVCRVVVKGICTGTGFVLVDNYIMTNAHLFKTCTDGEKLKKDTEVYVQFNYEGPHTEEPPTFKEEDALICYKKDERDYAVLQVNPQALTQSGVQIPSGLLERVGEMPETGGVCIIGHPKGEKKQIDLTSIIEIEKRKQPETYLPQYRFRFQHLLYFDPDPSVAIKRVLKGGDRADKVTTYHTFMYSGSSGSPVFDAQASLCGLHTGGFFFGPEEAEEHLIEFAYPMKNIITHLVDKLREPNQKHLPGLLGLLEGTEKTKDENTVPEDIPGPEPMEH